VTEDELRGMPDELFESVRRGEKLSKHCTVIKKSLATPERVRRMRRHYFANVTLIDEMVGRIIDALEARGLMDHTVIVFTSDHGDNLFDHGLFYKGELYDTVVNIPLIIWSPGLASPGRRVTDLVSQMDVAQYLLDRADVDGSDLAGHSLRRVLECGESHPRRYVYAEEGQSVLRPAPEMLAMVRSDTHKLVHFAGGTTGQLFDIVADPGETLNLWDSPGHRPIRDRLSADLLDWLYTDLYRRRDVSERQR